MLPGDAANTQYGFTYDPNANTYSVFPNPTPGQGGYGSGVVVSNNAINASGIVVGTWSTSTNASTAVNLAYYYDPSTSTVVQIHTPLDNHDRSLVPLRRQRHQRLGPGRRRGRGVNRGQRRTSTLTFTTSMAPARLST